jgi:hypothetical protein
LSLKAPSEYRRVRATAPYWLLCAVGLAPALSGCHDYRWTADYQQAEQQARSQNKQLFIFYKWWLSDESNRMHGEVLADPQVGALFQDTVNVLLEKDSSPAYSRYMTKYGVTSPPAFVIVAPDGNYQYRTGFIPKDRFIEFVRSAKAGRASSAADHQRPTQAP